METLVSTWSDRKILPENYVFPPEKRPGKFVVHPSVNVPVIDLSKDHGNVVRHIMQAATNFGFFQVINHGVPRRLMDEARCVFKKFFELPTDEKLKYYSQDYDSKCVLYSSNFVYDKEKLHFWRDCLKHSCTPLEECMQYWPQEPPSYREVAGEYVVKVRGLGSKLLELICEGLKLQQNYFDDNGLNHDQMLITYRYPPCPDPSLTLGAIKHTDPNLLTLLLQDEISGLQDFKDGQWIGVEPNLDAFVVNICEQLQIVSNGKLRSVEHRVVTNMKEARTSAAYFISPAKECLVAPAKAIVNGANLPLYNDVKYDEFFKVFKANYGSKNEQTALKNYSKDC